MTVLNNQTDEDSDAADDKIYDFIKENFVQDQPTLKPDDDKAVHLMDKVVEGFEKEAEILESEVRAIHEIYKGSRNKEEELSKHSWTS